VKVFTYSEDGVVREQEMDVNLDPNNPGRASCVWRGMLIACDRNYLIEWALNVETRINLQSSDLALKHAQERNQRIRANIDALKALQ